MAAVAPWWLLQYCSENADSAVAASYISVSATPQYVGQNTPSPQQPLNPGGRRVGTQVTGKLIADRM